MDYFVYCHDKPGANALRKQTLEAHWSFMDQYDAGFTARGPSLTDDGSAQTGSMHIVDLPDVEAVRIFAYEEPRYKAGVFDEVFISRWRNDLGHSMWDFKGDPVSNQRFLLIGRGRPQAHDDSVRLAEERRHYYIANDYDAALITSGVLLSEDGTQWAGNATMVELRDRLAVDAMLAGDPWVKAGLYERMDIHRWEFGGRR